MRGCVTRRFLVALNVLQLFACLLLLGWKLPKESEPRIAAASLMQDFLNQKKPTTTQVMLTDPLQKAAPHSIYQTSSYVFRYQNDDNQWEPPLKGVYAAKRSHESHMANLERLFFSSDRSSSSSSNNNQELLLFLRIPKTSSTSVWAFLQKHARRLATMDTLLNEEFHNQGKRFGGTPGCVFGIQRTNLQSSGGGGKKQPKRKSGKKQQRKQQHSCPHNFFGGSMKHVAELLTFLELPKLPDGDALATTTVSVHPFTMVRDPFDRMVSLFHYFQRVPSWQKRLTTEQKQHLKHNRLHDFLQSIHDSRMDQVKGLLSQQNYISTNTEVAQTTVKKGRVLMLVMECFDVSIQLLGQVYSNVLDKQDVLAFLENEELHHRNERHKEEEDDDDNDDDEGDDEDGSYDDDETSIKQRRRLEEEVGMTALRTKVETWFPDHFAFYRTVLQRFQKDVTEAVSLPDSLLSRKDVEKCFEKLGLHSET